MKSKILLITYLCLYGLSQAQHGITDSVTVYTDTIKNFEHIVIAKRFLVKGTKTVINEGHYLNGQRAFYNTLYSGKVNGTAMSWYPNGNLMFLKNYLLGAEIGVFYEWHENGKLNKASDYGFDKSDIYIEEKFDTIKLFTPPFPEPTADSIYSYTKKITGTVSYYYDNGIIEKIENYTNGKREGISYYYDRKGILIKSVKYKNDNPLED